MASLFHCFGKKSVSTEEELCDCDSKSSPKMQEKGCECNKVKKLLQCPHCKSTLHGFWESHEGNKKDGSVCAKAVCSDRDSQTTSDPDTTSDGNSPTTPVPISIMQGSNMNNNGGSLYVTDYRPMTTGDIAGASYMPVSKDNPDYNMNHRRRGKALIFNFDRWNNTTIPTLDLSPRLGSKKDKKDLTECLKRLSFEVETHNNPRRQVYDQIIERVRQEDHSDADCVLIAIMTHGEKNSIYLSDGSLIPVNTIWEEFEANKCPKLAGKPKIFLIQACRGTRYDHGTRLTSGGGGGGVSPLPNDVIDSGTFSYVIPNAADIFVAFSCPLGHYSWRHPENGSWFIQSICKVFNQHGETMELQSLLTTVARQVALNFESSTNQIESDRKKQVPSTSSTLIRNVFFRPKPFVPYYQLPPLVGNGVDILNHQNGNAHRFHLEDVQLAMAEAQSNINENEELNEIINGGRRPDALPILTVSDREPLTNGEQTLEVESVLVSQLALEQVDSTTPSEDLTPEDPSVAVSQEQPILPRKQ